MKYSIIRDVISLNRAHKWDSGIDFFIPKMNDQFLKDLKSKNLNKNYTIEIINNKKTINIGPHVNMLIPSGIKVNVPKGWSLNFDNKSGVGSKLGLDVLARVIDHGYQGEVHINLVNTSHEHIHIEEDKKIIQAILYKISNEMPEMVNESELYSEESERAEGGFGHTDNK